MPLHIGHIALIEFAARQCETLSVILCCCTGEQISGLIRKSWLEKELSRIGNTKLIYFEYNDTELAGTSHSSREVSRAWAAILKELVPHAKQIFSSEPYGDYVAEYMGIQHVPFDIQRRTVPVSATLIRSSPAVHWKYIAPSARPYFVRKVALVGTESTGKSTLAARLAAHFDTAFVPEMARKIIEKTEECTYEDLEKIAELHAAAVSDQVLTANRFLFVDTELIVTKSYASYLFNRELHVPLAVEVANECDLYLFLEPDCAFIQDGTRLPEAERSLLSDHHRKTFARLGKELVSISGSWEQRFEKSVKIVTERFLVSR
jgi:HTH-type transcriptional repressor of NAD biosynthesis genes